MANKNFTVKNGLEVGGQEVISSSGAITSAALGGQVLGTSASPSFANITTAGYLRGPASFVIDPAAHGDDTGTVVIAGNLQVDGTQTTINSTTMTVDDLNLTLASGAANAAAANGAGINVDITGATNPSLVYGSSNDDWTFNKNLNVTGNIGVTGTVDGIDIAARDAVLTSTTTTAGAALPKAGGIISHADTASEGLRVIQTTAARTSGGALGLFYDDQAGTTQPTLQVIQNGTGDILQLFDGATQVVTVEDGGNVGIGTDSPGYALDLIGATNYRSLLIGQSEATGTKRQAIAARHYTSSEQPHNMIGMFTDSNTNSILTIGGGLGATGDFNSVTEIQLHTGNGTTVNTTAAMTIDASGSVGIGNAIPSSFYAGASQLVVGAGSGESGITLYAGTSSTSYLLFADGTSGTAQYAGQVNYNHGTNELGFCTNNVTTPRMVVDATGNVGINQTNPSAFNTLGGTQVVIGDGSGGKNLTLYSSTYGHIAFADSNTSSSTAQYAGLIQYYHVDNSMRFYTDQTTRMSIDSSGNVGIGTTNPPAEGLTIRREGSDKQTLLQLDRPNTAGLQTNIKFSVADIMVGQIQHEYASSNYNHMSFTLRSVGGADIIPLWLENSGNVGIGTQTPDNTLHVHKGSAGTVVGNTNAPLTVENSANNYIQLLAPNANESGVLFGNPTNSANGGIVYSGVNDTLDLRTNGNSTKMIILGNGNVGIGTTAPAKYLTVGNNLSTNATDKNIRINTYYGTQNTARGGMEWYDGAGTTGQIDTRYDGSQVDMHLGSLYSGGYNTTSRMIIKGSGPVTMPYQPYANASSNSTVAATAGIPLNTNGRSRGGLTISGNRMTVPVAGAYVIGYQHLGNSGSGSFQMAIRVNNTEIGGSRMQDTNSSNDSCGTQVIKELAASDYIEFFVVQGTSHGNPSYNSMWAYLIG